MPKWTEERKRKCVRDSKGRFKEWRGGKTKQQLKKKENTYQGIAIHIGKQFAKQHKRPARVGEIVRFKTKSGAYHEQAYWYIRTKNGWRKSSTGTRRPTKAEIARVCKNSRRGR